MKQVSKRTVSLFVILALAGCADPPLAKQISVELGPSSCAAGDKTIVVPDGFCVTIFADSIGQARHLAVSSLGDVYVAVGGGVRPRDGGVVALRDADGDGMADIQIQFGSGEGDDVTLWRNYLFYSTSSAIVRYTLGEYLVL